MKVNEKEEESYYNNHNNLNDLVKDAKNYIIESLINRS